MRTGVLIRSYRLTNLLPAVITQYLWCDRILVMNYRFDNVKDDGCEDNTESIAEQFNCEYEKGNGLKQHQVFNRGLELLQDCDVVFISDADEFILKPDQLKLAELATKYDFVLCKLYDYIDYDHILEPRTHHPIVCVNPKKCSFENVRNANGNCLTTDDIIMYHFGHSWKGEDLKWKQDNRWYEDFHTDMAKPVESHPCPDEIRSLIESHSGTVKL